MSSSLYVQAIESISLQNKYTLTYVKLCKKFSVRFIDKKTAMKHFTYVEKHHIFPKCLGLIDPKVKENIIYVSAREHYILHLLLSKMFNCNIKYKMLEALAVFQNDGNRNILTTSRRIEKVRKANSESASIRNTGNQAWRHRPPDSEETRKKKSETAASSRWVTNGVEDRFVKNHDEYILKGWTYGRSKGCSEKKRKVASELGKRHLGLKRSDETKQKIKESTKKREQNRPEGFTRAINTRFCCIGCKKESTIGNKKWHLKCEIIQ